MSKNTIRNVIYTTADGDQVTFNPNLVRYIRPNGQNTEVIFSESHSIVITASFAIVEEDLAHVFGRHSKDLL